jgi:hypothetical protein
MSNVLAMVGSQLFQASTAEATSPSMRAVQYQANRIVTNLVPDIGSLIECYKSGYIEIDQFKTLIASHGIPVSEAPFMFNPTKMSEGIIDWNSNYNSEGGTSWDQVLRSHLYHPSIAEINFLQNREVITPMLAHHYRQVQLDGNHNLADMWEKVRFEIPGPSDLIRFAVREAYNPDLIQRYGYHKETPIQVLPWMNKQGYGQDCGIDIPNGGTDGDGAERIGKAKWFDLYWWSHWELPSLTQGYEMLHRLYSTSRYGQSPDVVGNNTFDPEDMELLQKAQDIPDYWRQRLQAISYHPLNRTDSEWLFQHSVIDEQQLYHYLRQGGYDDETTLVLIDGSKVKKQKNKGIDPSKATKEWVCNTYKLGLLNDTNAVEYLKANGWNEADSKAFLTMCKLEMQSETARQQTQRIEEAYYRGIYNTTETRAQLIEIGIKQFQLDQFMLRWEMKRSTRVKLVSARQSLGFFKQNIITENELQARLFNLGYEPVSITNMISNAKQEKQMAYNKNVMRQAKEYAKQAKAKELELLKRQREIVKQSKEQAKIQQHIHDKRLRGIIKAASDANLKAWFGKDLIQLWEIYYRLYYKDFSLDDAERYVQLNFPDQTKDQRYAATTKAQAQYRKEGNPPIT